MSELSVPMAIQTGHYSRSIAPPVACYAMNIEWLSVGLDWTWNICICHRRVPVAEFCGVFDPTERSGSWHWLTVPLNVPGYLSGVVCTQCTSYGQSLIQRLSHCIRKKDVNLFTYLTYFVLFPAIYTWLKKCCTVRSPLHTSSNKMLCN